MNASWRRGDTLSLAVVLVIAVIARALVSGATPPAPPVFDMADYWQRAVVIFETGRLPEDSGRMPGLPVSLAVMFSLAGEPTIAAARSLNIASGALTAGLALLLARRVASTRAALAVGLTVAWYPSLLLHTCLITTETLVTVPMLAALLTATYGSPAARVAAGVLGAAAALVRPAGVAVVPALLIAPWVAAAAGDDIKHRLRGSLLTVAGFLVMMLPWWLHGLGVHGRFVPLDTTSGMNVLIGHGPYTTGRYRYDTFVRNQRAILADVADVTTPEGSTAAVAAGLDYAAAHPRETARLVPAKVAYLLALEGNELSYLYSIGQYGDTAGPLVRLWGAAVLASFPVLVLAALAGLTTRAEPAMTAVRVGAAAYLGTAALLSVLTFGEPRFHLPFVPVLAVLATGLAQPGRRVRAPRLAAAAVAFVVLLAAWSEHLPNYLAQLAALSAPGGWQRQLPFDHLL